MRAPEVVLCAGIVLAASGVAKAQQADLVLSGARVLTADTLQPEAQAVAIKGGRILAIGSDRAVRARAGSATRVIDLGGRTVIPGLIDAHVHLLGGPSVVDESSLRAHITGVVPAHLSAFVRHGITTVRSTGDPVPQIVELKARLARGEDAAPRIIVTGPAVTSPGGHPAGTICRTNPFCQQGIPQLASEADARRVVRELAAAKVDQIKIVVDSVLGPLRFPQMPDTIVTALVDEAHGRRLRVVAHVLEAATMERLASLGVDEFIHAPQRFVDDAATARLASVLAARRVPVTTTLSIFEAYRDSAGVARTSLGTPYVPFVAALLARQGRAVKAFDSAGVRLVVGTDCCGFAERLGDPKALQGSRTLFEIETLLRAGVPSARILAAATRVAAQALGIADSVGTLAAGMVADLVVLDGDPLADPTAFRRIVAVIQGGRVTHGTLRF